MTSLRVVSKVSDVEEPQVNRGAAFAPAFEEIDEASATSAQVDEKTDQIEIKLADPEKVEQSSETVSEQKAAGGLFPLFWIPLPQLQRIGRFMACPRSRRHIFKAFRRLRNWQGQRPRRGWTSPLHSANCRRLRRMIFPA